MNDTLHEHIEAIIASAQSLLSGDDGELTERQQGFVKIILANAEKFIHRAADFASVPLEEVSAEMRHELGNPLTPIFGYSELMQKRFFDELNPAQQAHVNIIWENTRDVRELVDSLVARARAMASRPA
ncbi:MAG: histidine kinase dimerization/phospho-acceptor domain-containing protein [Chloroflexota bacterium]